MFCLAPANAYISRPKTINSPMSLFLSFFLFNSDGQTLWDSVCACSLMRHSTSSKRLHTAPCFVPSQMIRPCFFLDTRLCSSGANGSLHSARDASRPLLLCASASWFRCIKCLYRLELRVLHEEGEPTTICVWTDESQRKRTSVCYLQDTWALNHSTSSQIIEKCQQEEKH